MITWQQFYSLRDTLTLLYADENWKIEKSDCKYLKLCPDCKSKIIGLFRFIIDENLHPGSFRDFDDFKRNIAGFLYYFLSLPLAHVVFDHNQKSTLIGRILDKDAEDENDNSQAKKLKL